MALVTYGNPVKGVVYDSWLLSVREGPDITTRMIDVLTADTIVDILWRDDMYYQIKTPSGKVGYAHMLHVKEV